MFVFILAVCVIWATFVTIISWGKTFDGWFMPILMFIAAFVQALIVCLIIAGLWHLLAWLASL